MNTETTITLTEAERKVADQALIAFYMAGLEKKDRTDSILALRVANKVLGIHQEITMDQIFEVLDQ